MKSAFPPITRMRSAAGAANESSLGTAASGGVSGGASGGITPRDVRADLSGCDFETWHAGGRHVAHFFNAMSLFFPKGEKFFINSVKHHRDCVADAALASDITAFVRQEAAHSREHWVYLRGLVDAGYRIDHLDVRMFSGPLESVSAARRLAMTVAMEHFTASLAHWILAEPGVMEGDAGMCALWKWHSAEEIEHKAVAYDVLAAAYGSGVRARWLRGSMAIQVTCSFMRRLFLNHLSLVRQAGALHDWRGWLQLAKFLWVHPGLFRKMTPSFFSYFRRDFHPRNTHDRHLVERWSKVREDAAAETARVENV